MEWCLDEYEKLVIRMNTPRVVIDNGVCPTATLVKVDSVMEQGILLEAIQVLADLDLSVRKAYISSDGRWLMDVFHVTDSVGRKLADDSVISFIEKSLAAAGCGAAASAAADSGLAVLELAGADRPGLLSEVFAVLADLRCGVADAKVWTHNGRMAALVYLRDEEEDEICGDGAAVVPGSRKAELVEFRLRHVLRGEHEARGARAVVSPEAPVHAERRLHQMMFDDRDYERLLSGGGAGSSSCQSPALAPAPPSVAVQNWTERGYSVVNVQCRDRPKLLFDTMCTLTDMDYVVFHGTIDTDADDQANQEFYIRHKDGTPISSEAERQRVIICLEAAIRRRASQGLRLELRAADRQGLLADVTRTFRENGLSIASADVSTKGEMAADVFYVTDAAGVAADPKGVTAVRQRVGCGMLSVVGEDPVPRQLQNGRPACNDAGATAGGLFQLMKRNLFNLGLIRSCS